MTLASSGSLSLLSTAGGNTRSIAYEALGSSSPTKIYGSCMGIAGFSAPAAYTDWYGFSSGSSFFSVGESTEFFLNPEITSSASTKFVASTNVKPASVVKGTQIIVDNNYNTKNIEDLKINDLVWSLNEESGEFSLRPIRDISHTTTHHIYKITTSDTIIECNLSHVLFSNAKKTNILQLGTGDTLSIFNKTTTNIIESEILSIEKIVKTVDVYNIEVALSHTYVTADGVLNYN